MDNKVALIAVFRQLGLLIWVMNWTKEQIFFVAAGNRRMIAYQVGRGPQGSSDTNFLGKSTV